ncbi:MULTISPECIES: ribosomal-processing cysteine protease Prp [Saccharibacillus]|uniref:ribosomal-processing cysteine protease Prp n=1 Tax=Saccharibacillus TaxID=456492 RepID=UPI001239D739|nr:ribosomal-processing cysteine protease Prp [Saccharibacillus sp. WB 17]MWJ31396.1 ribosomal-processing cysteine protease Prp [Saccharibacillus sp. WB 17]
MYEPDEQELEFQKSILDEVDHSLTVTFFYNEKRALYGFVASGTSQFDAYGEDILSAGVSALILNTINSLFALTEDLVEEETRRNHSSCMLPNLKAKNRASREAITLLKSLEIGIEGIQHMYGEEHLTIERTYAGPPAKVFKLFK